MNLKKIKTNNLFSIYSFCKRQFNQRYDRRYIHHVSNLKSRIYSVVAFHIFSRIGLIRTISHVSTNFGRILINQIIFFEFFKTILNYFFRPKILKNPKYWKSAEFLVNKWNGTPLNA